MHVQSFAEYQLPHLQIEMAKWFLEHPDITLEHVCQSAAPDPLAGGQLLTLITIFYRQATSA